MNDILVYRLQFHVPIVMENNEIKYVNDEGNPPEPYWTDKSALKEAEEVVKREIGYSVTLDITPSFSDVIIDREQQVITGQLTVTFTVPPQGRSNGERDDISRVNKVLENRTLFEPKAITKNRL